MADFKTHISTSTFLGIGYAGAGMLYGVPVDSALVAGGLCSVSGMLPDIDSDSGVPFRESMAFAAAVIPMLLVNRFARMGMSHETIVLVSGCLYLFIRFVVAKWLRKYTVHRGMFHSVPAAILFAEVGFLICGYDNIYIRIFNAGAIFLGVMSHLVLDEIWSFDFSGGKVRIKKSFGTAIKFWGRSLWGNVSVYAKLLIATCMILSEPVIMDRFGTPMHHDVYQIARELLGQQVDRLKEAGEAAVTNSTEGEQESVTDDGVPRRRVGDAWLEPPSSFEPQPQPVLPPPPTERVLPVRSATVPPSSPFYGGPPPGVENRGRY